MFTNTLLQVTSQPRNVVWTVTLGGTVFFVGFLAISLEYVVLPDARGRADSPQQRSTVPTSPCKGQSWHCWHSICCCYLTTPRIYVCCVKFMSMFLISQVCWFALLAENAYCHLKLMRKADLGHWGNPVLAPSCSEDALLLAGAVCLCSCWSCWTVGWNMGMEGLNFTPIDHREREEDVKEGVIGTR